MSTHELPPEPPPLCEKCRKIPFEDIQENPTGKFKSVDIGTYDELKQSLSCPFCCLVFDSIVELARQWAVSRHVEFSGPDKMVQELGPGKIKVYWCHHYFDTSLTSMELRFTTGVCPRLGRVVSPTPIVMDSVTSLLQHCDTTHQCSPPISEEDTIRLATLRAIDVHQMCVKSISPSTRYVALSYVWGGVNSIHLRRSNRDDLMRPHALEACFERIPLTVRDAIALVRKTSVLYLWVDALCLVQDDSEDMALGINAMSIIYEHAYFTIIAADSLDADSGLPGITPREIKQTKAKILPGVQLVGVQKAGLMLDEMHYSHRAWTFQEFHMSRRKLVFLDGIMYCQCMESFWGEDRDEPPLYPEFTSLIPASTKPDKKIDEYTQLLTQYSTRQSTHQYDVVNAMVSVYEKILGESHGGHQFCVPVVAFDWFMCFHAYHLNRNYLERRERLPSWGWPGWRGRVLWNKPSSDREIAAWTAKSTWVVWYMRDLFQPLTVIWDIVEDSSPKAVMTTEQILAGRAANMKRFSADTLPITPLREAPPSLKYQNNILQFWTFAAIFNLRVDVKGEIYLKDLDFGTERVPLQVFDRDGEYTGFVYVDEESWHCDHDTIRLIAISEPDEIIRPDYAFIYTSEHSEKSKERDNGCWYNVLFIVESSGVAERKGFGQVYTDAIRASPDSPWEWEEIILG